MEEHGKKKPKFEVPKAPVPRKVRRLRGFRRVSLDAGQGTTVRFRLGADDFGFWTNDTGGHFEIEKGAIDIYVGNSSLAAAKTTLIGGT